MISTKGLKFSCDNIGGQLGHMPYGHALFARRDPGPILSPSDGREIEWGCF